MGKEKNVLPGLSDHIDADFLFFHHFPDFRQSDAEKAACGADRPRTRGIRSRQGRQRQCIGKDINLSLSLKLKRFWKKKILKYILPGMGIIILRLLPLTFRYPT